MRSAVLLGLTALLASGAAASESHDARHHRLAARARNATSTRHKPAKAAVCAPSYTPTSSVPTITGTGTLPKATGRVTRSGTVLKLGSKVYKVAGPNIVRSRPG